MNRRECVLSTCAGALGLPTIARLAGQANTITPDLSALADVMQLLRGLRQTGSTFCILTHVPHGARHADRSVQLFDGRLVDAEIHA